MTRQICYMFLVEVVVVVVVVVVKVEVVEVVIVLYLSNSIFLSDHIVTHALL